MGNWVYTKSDARLWTVGHYAPSGRWEPESDHRSEHDAAARVAYLNGGKSSGPVIDARLVYQQAIANVAVRLVESPELWQRAMQGSYREAENFARALRFAGVQVSSWHWDHKGDALANPLLWKKGPGPLRADTKLPVD